MNETSNARLKFINSNYSDKYYLMTKYSLLFFIVMLFVFTIDSCKQKPVDEKQLIRDKITIRTLGLAYMEENKLEEAEAEFLKLIDIAPDEALGHANLGLVYLRMDNYKKSIKQLDEAVKIEPKDPGIRLIRAKAFDLNNDTEMAIDELESTLQFAPKDAKVLYQLSELYAKILDDDANTARVKYLSKVVEVAPGNIVPRLQLIEILIQNGQDDEALKNLEDIGQLFAEFTPDAADFYKKTISALHDGNTGQAMTSLLIFHNFLKLTTLYQAGIKELRGPGEALIGFPVITFSESTSSFIQEGESLLDAMKFTDVTLTAGLEFENNFIPGSAHLSVGDIDEDGDQDIYFGSKKSDGEYVHYLMINDFGMYKDSGSEAGLDHTGNEQYSALADYDNDGHLDLLILKENGLILYRNESERKFDEVTSNAFDKVKEVSGQKAIFFDADHEGDLDVFIGGSGDRLLINNSEGVFDDFTDNMGFGNNASSTKDVAFGDFDDDGDIDLFIAREDGNNILYSNLRQGKFADITAKTGIKSMSSSGAVAVGDYNNDGYLDIFIGSTDGSAYRLYKNKSDGTFEEDTESNAIFEMLRTVKCHDVTFLDFDNDGHLDILVVGEGRSEGSQGIFLLHNDGQKKFEDVSRILPQDFTGGTQAVTADYNEDGDLDLYIADLEGRLRLLRNDGGNGNHHLKIKLVGLRSGSGKNNHFGIGAKVEVRAGDLYQMQVVTSPNVYFGMGSHTKADVVRILWTNGVPQNIFFPDSDRDLIEEQELKGSCPFLYTWNGEKYVFVKDMMWRSALGMPLGIMGGKTAYAFADASEEYLKIPGDLLQEKDGKLSVQITEELWETIYCDEIKLIAVDHRATTEIYVDEKFAAPPYSKLKIYNVEDHYLPKSAIDGKGNDLLELISKKDDNYVSNFQRAKYQGVTEMKDLILDLGNISDTKDLHLFLNGWIFPTDASINVALSQSEAIMLKSPSLEVINKKGQWEEVISSIGFPSGKNKTVIVDLSNKFFSNDRKVRIRTNMEIYWDYIFFAKDNVKQKSRQTELRPELADYHYRGYSKSFRKGGRYGPHWFDYDGVTTGQKWRDLKGNYTKYGDVTELLQKADDMYIIANAGDETTITFDATTLPKIQDGWKRDYLIYSVGWVKDGDINTALGQTVEPLPFHGMSVYPYGDNEYYPDTEKHRAYQKEYNLRKVGTEEFKAWLRSK